MITRELLAQYTYIEQAIESIKKKIKHYEDNPPAVEYGKVYGSSAEFPYTLRSFTISGYNGTSADKWSEKIRNLYNELSDKLRQLEAMRIEIEEFIKDIPDLSTQLIFSYIYIDGMKQEDVAKKLHMEQSTISKRITKYLDMVASKM